MVEANSGRRRNKYAARQCPAANAAIMARTIIMRNQRQIIIGLLHIAVDPLRECLFYAGSGEAGREPYINGANVYRRRNLATPRWRCDYAHSGNK